MRLDKDFYYLAVAGAVATRSTCNRRQYGAVIVKNDEIVGTGYNGAPRGEANCCDSGTCQRELLGIQHGERYELCRAIHAEANAITSAGRNRCIGATLYLTGMENGKAIPGKPCLMCERLIKNSGITRVVTTKGE